jgi:hypothetical protein
MPPRVLALPLAETAGARRTKPKGRTPDDALLPRFERATIMSGMRSAAVRQQLIESTGIDFAAYRHEEMVEALDVTSALFESIRRAVVLGVALVGATGLGIWITWRGGGGLPAAIILGAVGTLTATAAAAALWVKSLGRSVDAQVATALDIAGESVARFQHDLSKTDRLPGDRQLADGFLQVVVVPALGSAIRRRVWVLGRPLAALTERATATVLGRATAGLEGSARAEAVAGGLAGRLEGIVTFVRSAVDPVVARFQRWLIRPVTIGLVAAALLLAVLFIVLAAALGT